ncbi:MAG TPA: antibiotic biosynthesis monooxygenase family protein [Ginsengibacter sp.]|nr:antibiotic biosynthesis monooxygenase family protein [Ginsengibacter sp.]
MHARLTFINIQQEKVEELKRIFNEQIVPVVKSQKGNIGIWLLEPTDQKDEYISLTEWLSKADADNYESSGTYTTLVSKINGMYIDKPYLKNYNIAESKIMSTTM